MSGGKGTDPSSPPPTIYAISGLYDESSVSTMKSNEAKKTHRRQSSHPVAPVGVLAGGRGRVRHCRSHSYGQHHLAQLHSTKGVMSTLQQTLVCTDGNQGEDEGFARYLENLRRERQQRYEQQELHEMQDELVDVRDFGLSFFRPKCLQSLASIKVFVLLLSILVTLQQALSSGYINSVITTIEKRYEIPSAITGIIVSMYEIGNVVTVVFVSYLGSKRNIPSWIGMGVLVIAMGSLTFSLPHFLSESYRVNSGRNNSLDNICTRPPSDLGLINVDEEASPEELLKKGLDKIKSLTKGLNSPALHNSFSSEKTNCIEEADQSAAMPIIVFMIAQLLLGMGGSPLFTLGTTYIDNHVKRDSSSMYIGIVYSMCAFGPVCGFLLGAYTLSFYVDAFEVDVDALHIDSGSRQWLGMWWIGFLICGAALALIAIPFFFFPKEIRKEKVKVYIDEKYHHASDPSIRPKHSGQNRQAEEPIKNEEDNYGKDIKDIPRSLWKLLMNKIYMVTCVGASLELIIVSGFILFLPKYLETQFNVSKSTASLVTGGVAIPGACIGIFLGGYLLKRFQLRPKGAVQMVVFFNIICLSAYGLLFSLGCNNVQMAGTTRPYMDDMDRFEINLTAACNTECACDTNDVQPVCGANGITYFSPCHAGCTEEDSGDYADCACVALNPDFADGVSAVPVATEGQCSSQCAMMGPFLLLLFCMTLVVAVTQMPVLMVVLRAVEEEEKAFALGIQFVIFRILGYIPSPILFGHVIDSTCLLWKSTCEGQQGGSCLLYDIELFRHKYVGVCTLIKVCSLLIFLLDWWLIRGRQRLEKKQSGLTVGEVVNSIVSLDHIFDGEERGLRTRLQSLEGGQKKDEDICEETCADHITRGDNIEEFCPGQAPFNLHLWQQGPHQKVGATGEAGKEMAERELA